MAQTERMVAAPVATYQEDEQKDAKLDDSVASAIQRISQADSTSYSKPKCEKKDMGVKLASILTCVSKKKS